MKTNFISLALLSCTLFACMSGSAESLDKSTLNTLNAKLVENEQRYGTVSQSVIVKKQDKIIYDAEHGLSSIELGTNVHEKSQYPVYSLAKLFASVALMSLVEDGNVDLDKSIVAYLPNLPKDWAHVTVRHCLNHTSGLPEYFSMEFAKVGFPNTAEDAISRIAQHPFQFVTGDKYSYNNTNFIIIGAIIEHLTNITYVEYVKETIIQPLKLENTFYSKAKEVIPNLVSSYWGSSGNYMVDKGVDWATYSFSHSGLYSNKSDLLRFIEGIVAGKVLSKETVYRMWQPSKLNDSSVGGYASGWQYTEEGEYIRVGHEGGNRVRLDYHFKPHNIEENYTSIYLTNGNGFSGISTHLVDSLMATIAPKEFPTLAILNEMLEGAFNEKLESKGNLIVANIENSEYITLENRAQFIMERGWTLYFNSYPKYAITFYEFYTKHNPDDVRGWVFLADSWLNKGDKRKAIKYFKKALTIKKDLTYAQKKLEMLQVMNK